MDSGPWYVRCEGESYKQVLMIHTQVVGEACGDRTPEIHNANLFDLNAKYADVVALPEAIEHLSQNWS